MPAPDAATYGTTTPSTPAQGYIEATAGRQVQVNDVFAFLQTSLKFDWTASTVDISTASSVNSGGATVTIKALPASASVGPTVQLVVPSLSINEQLVLHDPLDIKISSGPLKDHWLGTSELNQGTDDFSYTSLGAWSVLDVTDSRAEYGSIFITGFHTPTSGMPTTGSAVYSNTNGVTGFLFPQGQTYTGDKVLTGNGTITANFTLGGGTLTGSFTNMKVNGITAWNNVTLTGTISGAAVTGTTGVSSTPAGGFTNAATGVFNGGFFGPAGEELGIIWSLQDSNKSIAAGTFGAAKDVPSDARLKTEIEPAGQRGDGLKLYSWRYLGGARRFTGVLAQDIESDPRFAGAVRRERDGLLRVDYAELGLPLADEAEMRREGEQAIALYRAVH